MDLNNGVHIEGWERKVLIYFYTLRPFSLSPLDMFVIVYCNEFYILTPYRTLLQDNALENKIYFLNIVSPSFYWCLKRCFKLCTNYGVVLSCFRCVFRPAGMSVAMTLTGHRSKLICKFLKYRRSKLPIKVTFNPFKSIN